MTSQGQKKKPAREQQQGAQALEPAQPPHSAEGLHAAAPAALAAAFRPPPLAAPGRPLVGVAYHPCCRHQQHHHRCWFLEHGARCVAPAVHAALAAAPAAAAAARSLVRLHAPQGGARPQVGGIMGHTAPGEHGLVLRRSLGLAGAGCWLQPLCHAGWGGFTQGRGFAREWGTLASRWTGRRHAVGGLQWWWAGRRATEAERAVGRAAEVPVPAVFAKGRRKVQGGHLRLHNAYSSIQDDCTQALHSPMEAQTESCQLVHAAIKISAVWWCRVIDGTGGFWTSGTILRNLAVPFRSSSCLPLNLLQKALCLCLEELQMCKLRKHGVLRIFCNRDAEKRVGLHLEGLPLYRVV
mmetsp:Transcript_18246/g.51158  ORF Transcript_18246/g.51158 Transcript_18246/m.51158 type:complete len:352 (+) Transcript_18246:548-1603(+)